MRYEDTVMSDKQLGKLLAEAKREQWIYKPHPIFGVEKRLLQAQAPISFKAGIREVVEWVKQNNVGFLEPPCMCIDTTDWQAKLKEWGIIDEN